jgi:hypothetical protein
MSNVVAMTPTDESPNPPAARRRWLRFRLRSLFVLLTVAGVWLGWQVTRARNQKSAVAAILQAGGKVRYDYQIAAEKRILAGLAPPAPTDPPGPAWLRKAMGDDFFMSVEEVDFSVPRSPGGDGLLVETPLSNKTFEHLKLLPRLKILTVRWLDLSDDGMRTIGTLEKLEHLTLVSWQVTDDGMKAIGTLRRLKRLSIETPQVTDDGLKTIGTLTRMEELAMVCPRATDASIAALRRLERLKRMSLVGERLSDPSIEALTSLQRLESLAMRGGRMTDGGLAHLARLPALRSLTLYGAWTWTGGFSTQITPAGLKHVAELPRLETLTLNNFVIGDDDLALLATMKRLKSIDFFMTEVSRTGMARLQRALANTRLTVTTASGVLYPVAGPAPPVLPGGAAITIAPVGIGNPK